MVDAEKIDGSGCPDNPAKLVDLAEGVLGEPEKGRLEQHLRACSVCVAALDALREVPSVLRTTGGIPRDEVFWVRERSEIMERIRRHERSRKKIRRFGWGVGVAAAAALVVAVIGYQADRGPGLSRQAASASRLTELDDETIAELTYLVELYVPEAGFVPMDVVMGPSRPPVQTGEDDSGEELRALSEDELEALHQLLGELG